MPLENEIAVTYNTRSSLCRRFQSYEMALLIDLQTFVGCLYARRYGPFESLTTGNFSSALDKLKEMALHYLCSLGTHTNLRNQPFLANKIFDAIICCSYTKYAKTEIQFCKRCLEISNKASTTLYVSFNISQKIIKRSSSRWQKVPLTRKDKMTCNDIQL